MIRLFRRKPVKGWCIQCWQYREIHAERMCYGCQKFAGQRAALDAIRKARRG